MVIRILVLLLIIRMVLQLLNKGIDYFMEESFTNFDELEKNIKRGGEIEFISYDNVHEEIPLLVDDEMMFVTMMMFFVSCYYLNKNYLLNHQRDYMMMRIIGMTKREMLIKD